MIYRATVWPGRSEGIVEVRYDEYASQTADLVTYQARRVAAAIETLMVLEDELESVSELHDRLHDSRPHVDVTADDLELLLCQARRLASCILTGV